MPIPFFEMLFKLPLGCHTNKDVAANLQRLVEQAARDLIPKFPNWSLDPPREPWDLAANSEQRLELESSVAGVLHDESLLNAPLRLSRGAADVLRPAPAGRNSQKAKIALLPAGPIEYPYGILLCVLIEQPSPNRLNLYCLASHLPFTGLGEYKNRTGCKLQGPECFCQSGKFPLLVAGRKLPTDLYGFRRSGACLHDEVALVPTLEVVGLLPTPIQLNRN